MELKFLRHLEKNIVEKFILEQETGQKVLKTHLFRIGFIKKILNLGLIIANAIIVYDNFFKYSKSHAVLSHELAHIYIFSAPTDKLKRILSATGWEWDLSKHPKWTSKNKPLKPDSVDSPSEDLANHIEDFLHSREELKKNRPEVFKLLEDLLGTNFRLKDQK